MAHFAVGLSLVLSGDSITARHKLPKTLRSTSRSTHQPLSHCDSSEMPKGNYSMKPLGILAVSVLILSAFAFGQQPPSDPTALSYAAKSVAAMTGSTTVSDATLTGTINTWMAGSTADTGTVTLKVEGYGESRVDMQLAASGAISQIRDASTGVAQGEAITGGTGTQYSYQNCVTDAAWFYALNSAMAVAPNQGVVLSYVGLETLGGSSVQHLQSYYYQSGLDPTSQAQLQTNSTIDYYLDATTFLPVAEMFNTFSGTGTAIPVQVMFLSYQTVQGVTSPQHIQEYINGTLQFDATITSVAVNTGIPLSTFTIPQ
jgi:hypothetical protein